MKKISLCSEFDSVFRSIHLKFIFQKLKKYFFSLEDKFFLTAWDFACSAVFCYHTNKIIDARRRTVCVRAPVLKGFKKSFTGKYVCLQTQHQGRVPSH